MQSMKGIPSLGFSLAREEIQNEDLQRVAVDKLHALCGDVVWDNSEQQRAFQDGIELAAEVFCAVRMAKNLSDGAISAGDCSGAVRVLVRNPIAHPLSDA